MSRAGKFPSEPPLRLLVLAVLVLLVVALAFLVFVHRRRAPRLLRLVVLAALACRSHAPRPMLLGPSGRPLPLLEDAQP